MGKFPMKNAKTQAHVGKVKITFMQTAGILQELHTTGIILQMLVLTRVQQHGCL